MRVVQVVLGSAGGIGTHVRDLGAGLGRLGHDVRVLTDAATQDRFAYPGAVVDPTKGERRRLLAGADVVHAHGYRAGFRAVRDTPSSVPVVVSLHNQARGARLSPRRLVGSLLAHRVMRSAALVTGASADLVDDARDAGARRAELAPVPSPRVPGLLATDRDVWRDAHRSAWLRRHDLDPERRVVLSIGRVAPQKRIDQLVAAGRVADPRHQWALVGPGQDDLADLPGGTGPLHLVGESDDVGSWLLAADALVLTSEWEARALVVQEAMAAGTPVVATDAGGLPDLLHGVGVLVAASPAGTYATRVAAAVDDLLADPGAAERLAGAARDRAAGWEGLDEMAARWSRWYSGLVPMT